MTHHTPRMKPDRIGGSWELWLYLLLVAVLWGGSIWEIVSVSL